MSVFPAFGATSYIVDPIGDVGHAPNLNAVSSSIGSVPTPGLYNIIINQYQNIGTFDLNGTRAGADTIQFRRAKVSDSVIEVANDTPFITIRNWRTLAAAASPPRVLRISNLAFKLRSPRAVLIDAMDSGRVSLILDSCVIFADSLSSNFIQWLSRGTGNNIIDIRRSYIVSRAGAGDTLILQASTVNLSNNVLNFPGVLKVQTGGQTLGQRFTFSRNTCSRVLLNASGPQGTSTASYAVNQNLIAHPQASQAGRAGYFAAMVNVNAAGSSAVNNRIYDAWPMKFEQSANTFFLTGTASNNTVIAAPPASPASTELWDWNIPSYSEFGAFSGGDGTAIPFNVFPGDTSLTTFLPFPENDTVSARFSFQTSSIPRILKGTFEGAGVPDALYPDYRFKWQGSGALRLGGYFRLNSIRLKLAAYDRRPVLFAKADTGAFQMQNNGTDTTQFLNQMSNAVQFHAAFFSRIPPAGFNARTPTVVSIADTAYEVSFFHDKNPSLVDPITVVNTYEVEVWAVNPQGETVHQFSPLDADNLGKVVKIIVPKANYNTFQLRYTSGGRLAGIIPFGSLDAVQVSKTQQEQARGSNTIAQGWQLAGLPDTNAISSRFAPLSSSKDTVDQRQVLLLNHTGSSYGWDSSVTTGTQSLRGRGALFGGTRATKVSLPSAIRVNLDTFTLSSSSEVDSGWELIANPYPFRIRTGKIRSNKGALSTLKQLAVTKADFPRVYAWQNADTLMPFTGYAYLFRAGEVLTFDPLGSVVLAKTSAAKTPASKTSASSFTPMTTLRLSTSKGNAEAGIFPRGSNRDIPALPAPGKSLDIRIGKGSGFWNKGLAWEGFEENLSISSPSSGVASLSIAGMASGETPRMVLLDSISGATYSGGDLQNLPVSEGENHFILVGGDAEFVQKRVGGFLASFSKPVRFSVWASKGRMNIDLNLPATHGGYLRMNISMTDVRGRQFLRQSFGATASGTQRLSFALPGLKSGIYFCEVQAQSHTGSEFRAARKVMLSP